MKAAMWALLVLSVGALLFLLIRQPGTRRVLSAIGVHVVVAAFLLYGAHLLSGYTQIVLPINPWTVGLVAVLGMPGLLLLGALKLTLI
ncbi:pro-sigmaK processing inhibitor BofA family protein [Paenibacillus lutrae]|uniref:Pro-sigmaK processing inhibitor BofA n=1 Tax=Paenibacillus lutrae TaxID=2078573 RepID=A0A7X3FMU1_9BACL|nr:pro-sigmaK processing inhibitor BofA family protein [Paenibacillus lutrae]MVP02517.1 pro-sigmaK processing inhibitor BofA [Paenibacillus lutrae]